MDDKNHDLESARAQIEQSHNFLADSDSEKPALTKDQIRINRLKKWRNRIDEAKTPKEKCIALSALSSNSIAVILDAHGRGIATDSVSDPRDRPRVLEGEIEFSSDGYWYQFHESEFPEYVASSKYFWEYAATDQPGDETEWLDLVAQVNLRFEEALAYLSKE
jgi:hypothetical protein